MEQPPTTPIYARGGEKLYLIRDGMMTHKVLQDTPDAYWCVPCDLGQEYWSGAPIEYISKVLVREPRLPKFSSKEQDE